MRELRVPRSSSDCMEGSGARQAADVKQNLKSYITKKRLRDVLRVARLDPRRGWASRLGQ